ncbi:MAG: glycoside hydrolase family 99-like domain-containing protein [Betaproteobacteria bacterium]|nr:glycoside hydrolase family 99-like domain-containing protein [Betaproteobacteria bacterium]
MSAPETGSPIGIDTDDAVRVIAFYLPQYHPIPENDAWWGKDFTEWTNVVKARSLFDGHWQPRQPGDLGYYDLRSPEVRAKQAALAAAHGIHGFCYYWYWFNGRRVLERPFNEMLASGEPDYPFCVCWANENWTRRRDGLDREILLAQEYSVDDSRDLIDALLPAFADRRYIRVNGRPLFLVYRPFSIPDVGRYLDGWRKRCAAVGLPTPYFAGVKQQHLENPVAIGFDAAVEFPPIGHHARDISRSLPGLAPNFEGAVHEYSEIAADFLLQVRPSWRQFPGTTPMWDNTARRRERASILVNAEPEVFGVWLEHAIRNARMRAPRGERLVFINAWNEWGEGNHLEPDRRYGHQFLEAVKDATASADRGAPTRPSWSDVVAETRRASDTMSIERFAFAEAAPDVSVVMPVYNHAKYIARTLASIGAQTGVSIELIAIDDGSSDDSADIVSGFAARATFPVTLIRQENRGAHVALNRGMALARAPTIALANSDDVFAPTRLNELVDALEESGTSLAFSATEFIDDDDRPIGIDPYVTTLRAQIARLEREALLYVLMRVNVAVSTGNFVFRRALVESIGGFAALRICHDWDFLLAATYETAVKFVARPLYRYRLHGGNTVTSGKLAGHYESEVLLDRFFVRIDEHPAIANPTELRMFLRYARTMGLEGFIPDRLRALGA